MEEKKEILTCEQARARIPQHARGTLQSAEVAVLRGHFEGCEPCEAVYRDAIETEVYLGKTAIEESEGSEMRRRATRARTLEGMKGSASGFRWRTILIPLFFAWLIIEVSGVFALTPRIVLVDAEGGVSVAGRPVEAYEELGEDDSLLLVRGSWCEVAVGGYASFELPGGSFTLTGPAGLLAEGVDPPRLRLQSGSLALKLDGPLTLVTQRGVLELESGEGLVVSDLGGLEIFWERGEGVLVDAKGETQLAPGIELQR
jgi:hypothetical protein